MMVYRISTATVALMLLVGSVSFNSYAEAPDAAVESAKKDNLYLVSEYDPQRDPAKDLAMAVKQAKKDGKNIILQVGGDWCGWCGRLTDYFHNKPAVRAVLSKNYVILKVNFSNENKNESFLSSYPQVPAFPHLFVLDARGAVLHSQFTGDLEEDASYNEEKVLVFLNRWIPKKAPEEKPATE